MGKKRDNDPNVGILEFEFRNVVGVRTAFATGPWPQFTAVADGLERQDDLSDIVTVDRDNETVTFRAVNGSATYKKFSSGVDAKAGETVFKLVEGSAYEEMVEEPGGTEDIAKTEEIVPEVLDTAAEDASARYSAPPMRLSERVSAAVRAATKASDHSRHAALHQLESAIGEFRRRCQDAVPLFEDGSIEHDILTSIATEL